MPVTEMESDAQLVEAERHVETGVKEITWPGKWEYNSKQDCFSKTTSSFFDLGHNN